MSITIKYKNTTIATVGNGVSLSLDTKDMTMEDNIIVSNTSDSVNVNISVDVGSCPDPREIFYYDILGSRQYDSQTLAVAPNTNITFYMEAYGGDYPATVTLNGTELYRFTQEAVLGAYTLCLSNWDTVNIYATIHTKDAQNNYYYATVNISAT